MTGWGITLVWGFHEGVYFPLEEEALCGPCCLTGEAVLQLGRFQGQQWSGAEEEVAPIIGRE